MKRNPISHIERGDRALARGDLAQALEEFEEASRGQPTDPRTWLRMAETRARLGSFAEAIEAYRQAGRLHVERGFGRHAVASFKNILALAPEDPEAHETLARLYGQLGLRSEAVMHLEQLVRLARKHGRPLDALAALEKLRQLCSDDARVQLRVAEMMLELGRREEALGVMRAAAEALLATGRTDEYLRLAERLLKEEPWDAALARAIAKVYLARGDGRYALARLHLCFEDEPKDAETLDLLAQAYELAGQPRRAVELMKALGLVHRDHGRRKESQDAFERALTLDPTDRECADLLAELVGRKRPNTSIEIEVVEEPLVAADPAAPVAQVTEEETLRMYMPGFVAPAKNPSRTDNPVVDLFPVGDVKTLVAECQASLERTAHVMRRLVGALPNQLASRALFEDALDRLVPGSELVTELALLADSLERNAWVYELGGFEARPETRVYGAIPAALSDDSDSSTNA